MDIDKYIDFIWKLSIKKEKVFNKGFKEKKRQFKEIGKEFDVNFWRERYTYNQETQGVDALLLPNFEQRNSIIETAEILLENWIDSYKYSSKCSVLTELEFLKSKWFDVWESDKLYFKEEYLSGHVVNVGKKNLEYWKAMNQLSQDIARIRLCNTIRERIKELESIEEDKDSQSVEVSTDIVPNYKKNAKDFDDIFTGDESKDIFIKVMKDLGMIDDNFNYLLGKKRSIILALILVCQKKGLIYSGIDKTPLVQILGEKLSLSKNLRINKCSDYEGGKVAKVIDKFYCK